jgi:acylphosphatase
MACAPTRLRWTVQGRVQGVFFRASTAERARALALEGWVRNLPDGRVEVVAAGDPAALGELTEWLWCGPRLARVDSVTVEEWAQEPEQELESGFRVR